LGEDQQADIQSNEHGLPANVEGTEIGEQVPDIEADTTTSTGKKKKVGKKKLEKLERKQEKAAAREAQIAMQEERKKKDSAYEEARRQREDEREAKRKKQEDEETKKREEEKKKDDEVYEQWKELITVETTGSGESDAAQESQGLLDEFISYIKNNKVVVLEELRAEFKLTTQDVVNRIQALESVGRITGILDDRGKYIYISDSEMDNLAAWLKQRGRVSISDVVNQANKIINLATQNKKLSISDVEEDLSTN